MITSIASTPGASRAMPWPAEPVKAREPVR